MKKYRFNWKKSISNTLFLIITILLCWFIISMVEIPLRNCGNNPHYFNWNLFKVILRYKELLP